MAEREILEGFGIYEDLGAFETLNEENSELPYVSALMWFMMILIFDFILKGKKNSGILCASPKNFCWKGQVGGAVL